MRLPTSLFAGFLLLATPSFALADDDSSDVETRTVTLQNGAVYRGELVELEPDDHITIKLATGEVKRFEWDQLKKVAKGRRSAAAPAAEETPRQRRSAPRFTESTGVRVTLKSDNPRALLYALSPNAEHSQGNTAWQFVCSVPCETRVDPNLQYRIQGEGIPTSSTFRLKWGESATVVVDAGSKGSLVAGWILFGLGATGATGGLLTYATASSEANTSATILLLGGLGMAVLGLALADSTTSVEVRDSTSARLRLPIAGSLQLTPRGLVF